MKTALPFLVLALSASAQPRLEPGRSIGKVSVKDNLIVMELDDAALGHANMFDLAGRTLHFTPDGAANVVSQGVTPDIGDRYIPHFPYLGTPKDGFHTPAS